MLHVLLLFGVCVLRLPVPRGALAAGPALVFTLAFVGATCVPVYAVFLDAGDPALRAGLLRLFPVALQGSVARIAGSLLRGPASDICAAVLLGAATYSKPSHALLVAPLVLWLWWRRALRARLLRRRDLRGRGRCALRANAAITGEFNYQGGDRKTF